MIRELLALTLVGLFLYSQFITLCFSKSSQLEDQTSLAKTYIFIIDINFICPICIASISELLDNLSKKHPEDVIGIVVCNNIPLDSEKNRRIILKQIEGFKIGNNLHFPFYIDDNGSFTFTKRERAFLLEFDHINKTFMKFPPDKK